jgi:hypothetical protein
MRRSKNDSFDWAGVTVRGVCGAVFGAALGCSWRYGVSPWSGGTADLIIFAGIVALCAFLSIRYGDDFWLSLRDWIRWR